MLRRGVAGADERLLACIEMGQLGRRHRRGGVGLPLQPLLESMGTTVVIQRGDVEEPGCQSWIGELPTEESDIENPD